MPLALYFHPFASFCQKVLVALYEKEIGFEPRLIDLGDPASRADLEAVWPLAKFPVLVDDDRGETIPESSLIIDYLDRHFPETPRLVPEDPEAARPLHLLDRLFDQYVAAQLTIIVLDALRPEDSRDPIAVSRAKATIAKAYDVAEERLPNDGWAAGQDFTIADCAAAPALFYANIVAPVAGHARLAGYYARLMARPSFARVVDEARPYRSLLPLNWPPAYR